MAFNPSAPFGQSSQPAFGQPPQQPNPANAFGAPSSANSPLGGKITFGARAAAGQQPAASSGTPGQPSTLLGSAAADGQNSINFGTGTGGLFGSGGSSQLTQGTALGSTPAFGGIAPGSSFPSAGFGTFGNGQQTSQGFSGFGAAAAVSSSPPASSPSNAFARLGARASAAPADKQSNTNSFGTPLFGRLGQTTQASGAAQPSTSSGILFGNQQAGTAFGFGGGSAKSTNPFAVPTSASSVQPVDFGRAAKRSHLQQQQTGADQQQAQADKHPQPEQHPKRPKSPALLSKQLPNQRQQPNASNQAQALSNDLADPAALVARSQRFGPGRPQSGGGSSWRASTSSGPADADADITDDQQGAVCNLLSNVAISAHSALCYVWHRMCSTHDTFQRTYFAMQHNAMSSVMCTRTEHASCTQNYVLTMRAV